MAKPSKRPKSGKLEQRTLPLDLPTPYAKPTGKVLDTSAPATLPLSNEITVKRCIGPHTATDRKLWATLIALAWDDLATKSIHETNMRDIARTFRELKGGENGIGWLIASAKRLLKSHFDWDTEEETGAAVLLSGLKVIKETGRVYYQFSDFMIDEFLDNKEFSRLRLHFMIGLRSKYSISLYMLLERAANRKNPVLELTVAALREALSVPPKKLPAWKSLKQKALDPAIQEINANHAAAGFSVAYEPTLRGRSIESVCFTVTKTDMRRVAEKTIVGKARVLKQAEQTSPSPPSLSLKVDTLGKVAAIAPGWDKYALEQFWKAWAMQQAEVPRNPDAAFLAWCKKFTKCKPPA